MHPARQRYVAVAWKLALLVCAASLLWLLLHTAWLSDDAYITLRVVDNLLHGYGLRWNVAERVQAYTHPLWLAVLIVPYAITRETLGTVSLLSIALFVAACWLPVRRWLAEGRPQRAIVFLLLLAGSKSVLSYATSGLENALALLLLLALIEHLERRPHELGRAALLGSLLLLTRLDLGLIAAPIFLRAARTAERRSMLRVLVIGAAPLAAWELFSLVYYGALVPNTALAKLGSGVPRWALIQQGYHYYQSLARWDPLGCVVLAAGLGVGIVARGRALVVGVLFYGVYLLWIGGDFMCGRFFMIPITLAARLLCDNAWPGRARWWLLTLPLFIFISDDVDPKTWLKSYGRVWLHWGIADERHYYYAHTGLLSPDRARNLDEMYYSRFGRRLVGKPVVEESCVGMVGFYAGPTVHLVDPLALGDPLLARLPMAHPERFRIGHFERRVPAGYVDTLRSGENRFQDPSLAAYWEELRLITRGPLGSSERLRSIARLLSGRLDPLRDAYIGRIVNSGR